MDELVTALDCCCNTSPNPNIIHNQMLSHLLPTSKEFQLSMYNHLWSENLSQLPRQAKVMPILKPGKDRSLSVSYRHISLDYLCL
jgi:hypothetical protein